MHDKNSDEKCATNKTKKKIYPDEFDRTNECQGCEKKEVWIVSEDGDHSGQYPGWIIMGEKAGKRKKILEISTRIEKNNGSKNEMKKWDPTTMKHIFWVGS